MDESMDELINATCQHPLRSPEWRKYMSRLILTLQKYRGRGLAQSSHPDYLEALNRTWEWFSQNICQFYQNRTEAISRDRLLRWINGYLRWRIRDLYIPDDQAPRSLDQPLANSEPETSLMEQDLQRDLTSPTLSGLDSYIENLHREKTQRLGLALEQYITEDPNGKLAGCFPSQYPDCNCQILCMSRCVKEPPDKFKDLATQLNMPQQKVSNHFYHRCKPLLQEVMTQLGYKPDENP